MCDENNSLSNNSDLCKNIHLFSGDRKQVQKFCFKANGIPTDIVLSEFCDKYFLVITQYQKIGTFILVTKERTKNDITIDNPYDVKTIGGLDCQDYHLAARYLAEQLKLCKPVLFSICLKDKSLNTLKPIVKFCKIKKLFSG